MGVTPIPPVPTSRYHDLESKSLAELFELTKDPVFHINQAQRDLILSLIQKKQLEELAKPHWTAVPAFWVSLIGALAACVAAYPVIQGWFK